LEAHSFRGPLIAVDEGIKPTRCEQRGIEVAVLNSSLSAAEAELPRRNSRGTSRRSSTLPLNVSQCLNSGAARQAAQPLDMSVVDRSTLRSQWGMIFGPNIDSQ